MSWSSRGVGAAVLLVLVLLVPPGTAPADQGVRIRVDEASVVYTMRGGWGASWHAIEEPIPHGPGFTHGGSAWGGNPPATDHRAWEAIYRHADWLGLDWCRVELEQRMYEPQRGQVDWNNPEMQVLYRILDWCQTRRADVFLQQMWGNVEWNTFPEWRGDPVARVHSGPASMEDFAEGLATLADFLLRDKGYTCIRWLSINNEPGHGWSWWNRPPKEPMSITPGLAAVRQALDQRGIALPLSGPDWTDLPPLEPAKIDFDRYIGAYDLHSYWANYDGRPGGYPLAVAIERLGDWARWAHARGKPLFLSELGSMAFGWRNNDPNPGSYQAVLKDAELVIRGLGAGVDAFNRWSFINRGDLDGQWQLIDTWDANQKRLRDAITPHPNAYYLYGLLTRFTAKHSAVLDCSVEGGRDEEYARVFAAAVRSPAGELTILVVNDSAEPWDAAVDVGGLRTPRRLYRYRMTPDARDRVDVMIRPDGPFQVAPAASSFTDSIPGRSLTAYSTYRIEHDRPGVTADPHQEAAFREAERNARQANEQFSRCRRFVDGWLQHADPQTGLIPRNLNRDRDIWNAQDSAADNYPFMVLTCALTERPRFEGRMLDMLRTETRLTSRVDRLPDTWSFARGAFQFDQVDLDRILFASSEYVKDGLMPLAEWLGRSPWFDRLRGILDDIWKHAPVETPWGNIPSTNVEVNGEMLQVLSRIYWMTGDQKYLDYASRLGRYYLLGNHHPTRDSPNLKLLAHGGEIVSGLCEHYATVHFADPEQKEAYRKPLHAMCDRILDVGRNEHGMFYVSFNPQTGEHHPALCDTWGYTYNAFYTVYLIDRTERYRRAVTDALAHVNRHYRDAPWIDRTADGYADAIEGALNLYNRERIRSVAEWLDSQIPLMWQKQRPDGVIEGWHGDGNVARTGILYALWKTQGLTARPWRSHLRFGSVFRRGRLLVSLTADEPWKGKIVFDKPRHKQVMHLPIDYPRLNQFPEWFTARLGKRYRITDVTTGTVATYEGRQLQEGVPVQLEPQRELRWVVAVAP